MLYSNKHLIVIYVEYLGLHRSGANRGGADPNLIWGRVESRPFSLPSLIKPYVRFSRIRLSDVIHRKACAVTHLAVVGTL